MWRRNVTARGPFPSGRRRNSRARRRTPRCALSAKEDSTFKGFGTFIARGNVIDLAVAVIVGSAFTAVVNALVKDILTPLVAAIIGQPDFSKLGFTIRSTHFPVGDFVNALITFLLDALVIYYAVVVPFRTIAIRFRQAGGTRARTEDLPGMSERDRAGRAPLQVLHRRARAHSARRLSDGLP